MRLLELHIKHLRVLRDVSIALDPGFNYIFGANGAGKTALLEAVYLLARGRSFRSARAAALINRDEDAMAVRARIERPGASPLNVSMKRQRNGETSLQIDGKPESRVSELARYLPVQLMLPGVADLIFAGPGARRSYLDWGLFHVEHGYLEVSRQYRRVLAQRNAWLKSTSAARFENDPWLAQLLEFGQTVSQMRGGYLQELQAPIAQIMEVLEPNLAVTVEYRAGGSGENIDDSRKKMSESFLRDVKFGTTHCGPHRADVRFAVQDRLVAEDASRGQAKLIASAAVLGQALHLQRNFGLPSVILIDDFGAELDAEHWRRYVDVLLGLDCQVIATSTDEPSGGLLPDGVNARVFHVEHGRYDTFGENPPLH